MSSPVGHVLGTELGLKRPSIDDFEVELRTSPVPLASMLVLRALLVTAGPSNPTSDIITPPLKSSRPGLYLGL